MFGKLRRAIEDAEGESEEADAEPADRENGSEEEDESADPLGRLNYDADSLWDSPAVPSTPVEVADGEPLGHTAVTDAALEEMEASAGAMLAFGLVREVASRRRLCFSITRPPRRH